MNRVIRFYNQNRHVIWLALITIIGIIVIMNELKVKSKRSSNEIRSSSVNNTTTSSAYNYSIISKETISEEKTNKITSVINNFMLYCNNNEIEEAYSLISDDCKQEIFGGDINQFIKNYYNKIFTQKRIYSIKAWIVNNNLYTYQITITEDLLATGMANEDLKITDYITVVLQNGEYKLNINNYVGKEEISKQQTTESITINIKSKQIYMDYEIYEIEIINKNNTKIALDAKQRLNTTYLEGINGKKYIAFLNEVVDSKLTVESNSSTKVNIKFNKSYNPDYEISKLVFSEVILDYNKLINNNEKIKSLIEVEI